MKNTYNWGILGLGNIAHKFAQALRATENGNLLAVGSRTIDKAENFASQYNIGRWYGNYEDLIRDDDIQIVYISTTHNLHYELAKKSMEAGKHVLCEKPVTINSRQFEQLRELAESKNVFFMEALWTRFLPHMQRAMEFIEQDKIGEIKFIKADFGIKIHPDFNGRLLNLKLGGGSILDIGIYPIFLSLLLLGYPDKIVVDVIKATTGADESCNISFAYKNGSMASLSSTFQVNTETTADIAGTKGRIKFHHMFFRPTSMSVYIEGESSSKHEFTVKKNGYEYEAIELMECLDKGLTESPKLPLSFTSQLMKLLDAVRKEAEIIYDEDQA
ncbi:MAG: Gfo/Idh/MocA family protein [Bacteroidota bacterium]